MDDKTSDDRTYNVNKEITILDCIAKFEQARNDLQIAREMGGGFLDYIEIKKDLDRYQNYANDRLESLMKLKEQET